MKLVNNYGPTLDEKHSKSLHGGLFEFRVKAREGIARALFCYSKDQTIIILVAYIKKTQKTPKQILKLAKSRFKEIKNHV